MKPIILLLSLFSTLHLSAQIFTRGHYVDLEGQSHEGAVAYQVNQDHFLFKEKKDAATLKLQADQVQRFSWGVDTFAVVQGTFARVVIGQGPVRLYERRRMSERPGVKPIVGEVRQGHMSLQRDYLLERVDTGELIEAEGKEKKFKRQMSAFFADAPALVARIEAGEFNPGDVEDLVRAYGEAAAQ